MDDLTPHLHALASHVAEYGDDDIVAGALWALSMVSGEPVESLRPRLFETSGPAGTVQGKQGIRYYSPPVGGMALIVTREAESLAVDPNAPVTEANQRSFSALAEAAEAAGDPSCKPLTDEDRDYIDSLPAPSTDEVARMVAAAKAAAPNTTRQSL